MYYVNKIYKRNYGFPKWNVLLHDLDKIIPILLRVDRTKIKRNHNVNRRHHLSWIKSNLRHYNQNDIHHMICDWESARFSKPYKQLSAWECYLLRENDIKQISQELAFRTRLAIIKLK